MSNRYTKTPHPDRPEPGTGRDHDGPESEAVRPADLEPQAGAAGAMVAEVELALSDLVGDRNGEVVFFNDSGLRRLSIATDATVVADGRTGSHRTAAGEDVSGFSFLSFDNGLTLYYQPGLDVVVRGSR
jgi:hypothetical protein